jgi:acetyl/propionyl-CoA carboxylase alpha subunit
MKLVFGTQALELSPAETGYTVTLGDRGVRVEVQRFADGELDLLVDGTPVRAHVSADGAKRWVTVHGRTWALELSAGTRGAAHVHASDLSAPMPGQVRSVHVQPGEAVRKGQTLLVLEAMKMETRIQAPAAGVDRVGGSLTAATHRRAKDEYPSSPCHPCAMLEALKRKDPSCPANTSRNCRSASISSTPWAAR